MPFEIERKFLVINIDYTIARSKIFYRQGYLKIDESGIVRVRVFGDQAAITVKSKISNIKRREYEYAIPVNEAEEILDYICQKPLIEKNRYKIDYKGFCWEVDEFLGGNAGLVIAEIELENENIDFPKPPWIGKEVSDDARYYNAALVENPFKKWKK